MNRHSSHLVLSTLMSIGLAAAPSSVPDARAEAPPVVLGTFGTCGTSLGQIQGLWGIAAGPDGAVYVADWDGQRISKFDGATGAFLTRWSVPDAFDVAVAPDGSVYVLCQASARIDHFSATGAPLGTFGSFGSGDGQFNNPFGIAIDPQGQLFIADTGNHRIQRLSADGTFLGKWNQSPFATEIAVDAFGNVFVIDEQVGRVYRYSTTGAVLGGWSNGGPSGTPIAINYGLAVDPAGSVYLVAADRWIEKYTPSGAFLLRWGDGGTEPGNFRLAMTITIDPQGQVYVSDRTLCRVTKFGFNPPVPTLPISWGKVKAAYR